MSTVSSVGNRYLVSHDYHPAVATSSLFEVDVTITDTLANDSAIRDVRYRRHIPWLPGPTTLEENSYTTTVHKGLGPTVEYATNCRLSFPDPFFDRTFGASFCQAEGYTAGDSTDQGPLYGLSGSFDFIFRTAWPDRTIRFKLYYGAATSTVDALQALAVVGVDPIAGTYSLAKATEAEGANVFIFGYRPI